MNCVRAKLHSSSGASLAFALIFLLFSLMVGAVVLTAAASNVGRITHERDSQQDYFTVSSAARLFRDRLEGLTYSTGEQQAVDDGPDGGTTVNYLNSMPSSDTLTGLAQNFAERVFRTQTVYVTPSGSMPGDESLAVVDTGLVFDGVSATLSMDADYDVTIALSLAGSAASYPLTLTFPADVQDDTSTEVTYYTVTEEVEGVPTEVTYSITTTTRTVTITWDDGVISKGG